MVNLGNVIPDEAFAVFKDPSSSFSSLVIIPLEPSLLPTCSCPISVAEMRGSVSPRFLWLRCKCPLTELRLHVALPLLPCIPVPIFEGLCKGLVPFYWMGLEPERGLRCQRKGCGDPDFGLCIPPS